MKTILIILLVFTTDIPWSYNTYQHMEKLNKALNYYYDDCGVYPTDQEGLSELMNSTKDCWKGPYAIEKMLIDRVTGKKYKYKIINVNYVITSAGMDGVFKTDDDFHSSDNELVQAQIINEYIKEERHMKLTKQVTYGAIGLIVLLLFIWALQLCKRNRINKTMK